MKNNKKRRQTMADYVWVFWFVAVVVLIIVEIFTPSFFTSLVGVSAFFAGVTSMLTKSIIAQLTVFALSNFALIFFVRPIIIKYFPSKDAKKSNVAAIIGKEVIVTEDIDNGRGVGYVKDCGDYWRAASKNGTVIKKGTKVVIEKMEGNTVTVSIKI
jgi:membrane protein implicated in regulation of membrane protease activity